MSSQKNLYKLLVLSAVVLLSVALTGCGSGAAPSEAEAAAVGPKETVERFYEWYTDYPGNVVADKAYRSSETLTKEFVEQVDALIASFDQGGYDPFLCAQDIPGDMRFEAGVMGGEGKEASVVVHEVWNPGSEYELVHDLTVKLVLVDGKWLISDIVCPAP